MSAWVLVFMFILGLPSAWAGNQEWRQLKGLNFIISYRPDVPMDFAQTVLDSAQEDFERISNNLGITRYQNWRFDQRAVIMIYSGEEDYVKNGSQSSWSHGATFVRARIIRTFPQAHGFFDSTLPHELAHIIFREIVGVNVVLPLWFEEGVAMNQEKAKRFGADKQVLELMQNGKFITLTDLTNMGLYNTTDVELVQHFYTESASVFNYLINEYGEQKFHHLLKEFKENTPFEVALAKVYMRIKSINDLSKWWVNYLKGDQ